MEESTISEEEFKSNWFVDIIVPKHNCSYKFERELNGIQYCSELSGVHFGEEVECTRENCPNIFVINGKK